MATGHDLAMGLRAAYWAMHRQTDARLAPSGVTADQFVLLALLAEQDGISQQDLVRRASSDPNTVRAMLVRMERRGLVARERHPSDRRVRCVTLTGKGRRTYKRWWARIEPLQRRLLAVFRSREARTLVEFLTRIVEAMAMPVRRGGRTRPAASVGAAAGRSKARVVEGGIT